MSASTRSGRGPSSASHHVTNNNAARFSSAWLRLAVLLCQIPISYAVPLVSRSLKSLEDDKLPKSSEDPDLWIYLGTAIALVLLGGAFAGLTIALMGQDEIYLQVIATSGEGIEKKHAKRVLNLLKRGKHWVLVTLLLSNVITNETLPIVLDRSLGGGWPAVLSSTILIVIFGEIAPQSVCVRYGLPIGAWMSPFVLGLMWVMSPIAWPTAKLLDWLLGEDHGTVYKKAGLKTLVTLHKTLGETPGERLNEDEVTIISAVLDLKGKAVGSIMTPMADVFTMSADTVLDVKMMDTILSQGYSRIPIYAPENPDNYIGMLLVKILITYDPEDSVRVRDFALATLPETAPSTSCLDIVNFFQEGKSHMVLVSEQPGQAGGALGVVTLEDVIEELIGEEIIDESDVFVDVHKAIRRHTPAPHMRLSKHNLRDAKTEDPDALESDAEASEQTSLLADAAPASRQASVTSTRDGAIRSNSGLSASAVRPHPMHHAKTTVDMRQHFKHLGPSNVASRPRATKYTSVKIKPGLGMSDVSDGPKSALPRLNGSGNMSFNNGSASLSRTHVEFAPGSYGTIKNSHAPDGIDIESEPRLEARLEAELEQDMEPPKTAAEASALAARHTTVHTSQSPHNDQDRTMPEKLIVTPGSPVPKLDLVEEAVDDETETPDSASSQATLGPPSHDVHRTSSITENVVDLDGVKKVVLETNPSSSDESQQTSRRASQSEAKIASGDGSKQKKKRSGKKSKR